jgi:hypothetical protein
MRCDQQKKTKLVEHTTVLQLNWETLCLQPYKLLIVWEQTIRRRRPQQQLNWAEKQHGKLHIVLQYFGKFSLEESTKDQRGSRVITLLFS